ncbi:ABC transporter ATP-binding protein [Comamonas aquatica]|uniref:ABC transporter ATP-binding protein n=1 Tax=Comamonas aquatica TaxID=225991 RepID=UPI002449AB69|nr:ABC transporter ATP-binding protein [Comamonas aquatica]MDH0372354.1 ABC transporter ATP-binding protein [Comamonas aquatica]MDH0383623.1 ABC transporter ATP-binding protein [Comamonas aquatica]MDH0431637.1 ABC transporter ATP-binding protein [Comamonas aquatica]MDH0492966.1 ABC transporter ATP-binding protein [Comamonas aquatica]MDH0942728.1 ABC transporter ATP-binding protein [Comamonas aquatica]
MHKQHEHHVQPEMAWTDLWPVNAPARATGWSETLPPGLCVVVDDTGDEAARWMPVLAGHALPAHGQVRCAGVCSQEDPQAYTDQVYWHNPRQPLHDREMSAQQWLQTLASHWPNWSDADCRQHCEGFALQTHLSKPLWHLSTGSLRKLGLVAALCSGARLTLIEEPIAGLDSDGIHYLCQALDALEDRLADPAQPPRWVLVAHWEPLPHVLWDEVLAFPLLPEADSAPQAGPGDLHRQQNLLFDENP